MRLFIGIAPDDAAQSALAQSAALLSARLPGRYHEAERYHLTLAFLGEQPKAAITPIVQVMRAAASGHSPFTLSLGAPGLFGRTLWRGVRPQQQLMAMAEALRLSLSSAGICLEALPFVPHITLARLSSPAPGLPVGLALPGATWRADAIFLYESVRGTDGTRYEKRAEVIL